MELILENKIPVFLSEEEAQLFLVFQKNYLIIANILGTMDAFNIKNISNASLTMDFDKDGIIAHSSITKHYRK